MNEIDFTIPTSNPSEDESSMNYGTNILSYNPLRKIYSPKIGKFIEILYSELLGSYMEPIIKQWIKKYVSNLPKP